MDPGQAPDTGDEPLVVDDEATQTIGAVPEPGAPDATGGTGGTGGTGATGAADAAGAAGAAGAHGPEAADEFGGRPMFRDESPRSGGTTAEIDLSEMDELDAAPRGRGRGRRGSGLPRGTVAKTLAGVGFVALLGIAGTVAFMLAGSGSEDDAAGSGGAAAAEAPGEPQQLESGGLFPETLDIAGEEYTLALVDDTDDCATVGRGSYGGALDEAGCRQVIRATYVSESGDAAVTAGVAALGSPDAAAEALEAQDLESGDWFAGLNGTDGSGAEEVDTAAGVGSGGQWGPYLLFSFASNADGSVPGDGGPDLEAIAPGFVDSTLSSLSEQVE